MANSTTHIDAISQSQAGKEVVANAYFDAASPATLYGRRASSSSGLTFGFYGGNATLSSGSMAQISNGTVSLTASATNYVVAAKSTGTVSVSTSSTNWNNSTDYWRLYSVVTGSASVTSWSDAREIGKMTGTGSGGGSGSPGGSTTQVQYNNAGAFAGSSSFTWDESTKSLKVRGSIEAFRDDATQADISATTYGVNGGGIIHGKMANGTYASPTAILSGDIFGGVGCRAYHSGGAFQVSSPTSIHWVAAENQTGAAYGSYLRILTTPKGSTTRQERVIVADDGTLWCHDTGTFDPKVSAQTRPFSDTRILASGVANVGYAAAAYGTALSAGYRGGTATGTPASPGATAADTLACFMGGHFHDGTNWTTGTKALIAFKAGQAITSSNQGSYITFETTPLNSTTRAEGARLDPDGNFLIQQAGKGLRVKEGSNAKQGTVTLVAGAATVSNTSVTANSRIFLTSQSDGGTPGWLRVSARSAGTSFTITSSSGSDTSTVAYQIFEPA